jgi:hypothetical protein
VGVLAATAISNPAYKAVLDSSQSNNASWELMKVVMFQIFVAFDHRGILFVLFNEVIVF